MHLKDNELVPALSGSLGEDLLAAAYARVSTALGLARVLTPLGNYLIARPAARPAARKVTEETAVPLDAARSWQPMTITLDSVSASSWKGAVSRMRRRARPRGTRRDGR